MRRLLITGFSGFVARHYVEHLLAKEDPIEIYGISRRPVDYIFVSRQNQIRIKGRSLDLMKYDRLKDIINEIRPDYILHLAAFSSVAYSWKYPTESFVNNCNIFLNLLNAVRETRCNCRILSVGSSEEYGNVPEAKLPIREEYALNPVSPYAAARVSQEILSRIYVDSFGMDIVMTRSFNHIGPRQDTRFVVPSFISRMLDISETGESSGFIETGDLSIVRDFVDVRDVAAAYDLLMKNGKTGEIYNICSGVGLQLSDVVKMIAGELKLNVETRINPDYVRPNDNRVIIGSPDKMEREVGWVRKWSMEQTIRDMVKEQKSRRRK